ncbi:MAG: hypothetical protein ABSA02_21975 [Trebonia sp.]
MPEKAIISHRGEKYEIGRGKRFYGIWAVGAPYDAPVDRWPETRDGWGQAWMRFAAIEAPGTITTVPQQRGGLRSVLNFGRGAAKADPAGPATADGAAGAGAVATRRRGGTALLAGEGLLVLGIVLSLAGLFPDYFGGQSLLSQSDEVVPHLCYVIAWAASAGLIALSVSRPRTARLGALFALGLSVVTFGLFLSDLGAVTSGAQLGSGLVVSLLGWLACTVGAALALVASCRDCDPAPAGPADAMAAPVAPGLPGAGKAGPGWPARPTRGHAGPLALLVLAGIGTAAAFAPSWDSYTLTQASTGTTQTYLEGNAFSNPGLMIAGSVAVMVAVVLVAALAALWRPAKQGAWLLAGAIVPMAAQAVSALIQVRQPAFGLFGLTQAQAKAEGVTIAAGVTPIFWVYVVFVIALLVSCAWLMTTPGQSAVPAVPVSPWTPPADVDAGQWPGGSPAGDDVSAASGSPAAGADAADRDAAAANDGGTGDGEHSAYA